MNRKKKPVSELMGFLLTLRYDGVRGRVGRQIKGGINLKCGRTSAVKY